VRRAPWAAEKVAVRDRSRIVRWLELSDLGELEPPRAEDENQLWTANTRHPTRLIGLTMEREALYGRINRRIDQMIAAGARDEVIAANRAGASDTARKALGFDDLLSGDVEGMKRRTRNYARRQLTWMRKLPNATLIDVTTTQPEDVAAMILGA
jgi:tRNA dimethylallyltransferase